VALLSFVHLFATVAWIGGIMFFGLVFMPLMAKRKELGPAAGRLSVDVAKRLSILVWGSFLLFLITGVPMTLNNPRFPEFIDFSNLWMTTIFTKHIVVAVMVIVGIAQTFTIRRMDHVLRVVKAQSSAEKQTSNEMTKLKRRQMALGFTGFILGMLVLLLTAIAEAAFIPG